MHAASARAYPLLIDALRLLPVQPFREREELGFARHRALQAGFSELRGVSLPKTHLDELFLRDVPGAPRVSPSGAQVLLELFRRGALERIDRRVDGGIELLEAYAQGRASILGPAYWKKPRARGSTHLSAATPVVPPPALSRISWPHETRYRITAHRLT
jgi:hypothetical protein